MRIILSHLLLSLFFLPSIFGQKSIIELEKLIEKKDYKACCKYAETKYQEFDSPKEQEAIAILNTWNTCLLETNDSIQLFNNIQWIKDNISEEEDYTSYRKAYVFQIDYYYRNNDKNYLDTYKSLVDLDRKHGSLLQKDESFGSYASALSYYKKENELRELCTEILSFSKNSRNKMLALEKLGNSYRLENGSLADSLYREANKLVALVQDSMTIMGFHRQYSNFLSLRQQKRLALDHALTSLDFTPADPQMDYSKAQTLSIIAQLFDFLNDKRRAREYINKAIKLTEARGFKYRGEVASFNSIILLSENKEDEALAELEKSISYYTDIKFYDKLLETRAKIGHIYFKRKDYKQAESEYNKIITLQKEHDIGSIGKSSLLLEAKLLKLRGDIPKAIEKYNDILDLATESNTPSLILSAYKGLSNIYMSTNQLKKGIVYSEKYHQLKDSIFLNDQNKEVLALEASYDREKKEQQIQVLDTQNKLQTVQLSSQRKLLFTSLGFISIVLLISGLLYRLFRKVKSQNKVIEKTLGEKDLLLKEIHHRVKNNLQLVSSLLTLQSKEIEDKKAIEAINAGKSRVRSMALIHQDLYSRDNLKSISVKKYLDNLCKELFHTYNINESKIQLSLEIQDLYLDIDSIIPLGLIINELITNSLKYAFVSKDSGNLSIKITENSKQLVLTVKDDGTGFDPQAFENSNSFGNKLIKTLSEQLDGKITYHAAEGAEIQINFNDYKIAS